MIYPPIYLILVMARGALIDYYPYPFLMVTKPGYSKELLNCQFITLAFFFLGFVIIELDRTLKKSGAGRFQRQRDFPLPGNG